MDVFSYGMFYSAAREVKTDSGESAWASIDYQESYSYRAWQHL